MKPKDDIRYSPEKRAQRLVQMARECIAALDMSAKPIGVFFDCDMQATARWPVVFFDRDLERSVSKLSNLVLEKMTATLRQAQRDLTRRDAQPAFGFGVAGVRDLSEVPGWQAGMERWMVVVTWCGPKPMYWPHAVTLETAAMPKDEDLPSDYDFAIKYGERPEKMMRRLAAQRNGHSRA